MLQGSFTIAFAFQEFLDPDLGVVGIISEDFKISFGYWRVTTSVPSRAINLMRWCFLKVGSDSKHSQAMSIPDYYPFAAERSPHSIILMPVSGNLSIWFDADFRAWSR
jgi:hypothetical protein